MTGYSDSPQMQMPDIFAGMMAHMEGIGKAVMDGAQAMGDLITEALGDLLGKAVNGTITGLGKGASLATGAVAGMGKAVSAPFNASNYFSPSATPAAAQGAQIEAPSRGLSREITSHDVSMADLGNFTPNAGLPGQMRAMGGYGRGIGC